MPDQRAYARKRTIVPAAVAVAAALVAVALILLPQLSGGATERDHAEGRPTTGDPASQQEDGAASDARPPSLARRKAGDPLALGRADAPVVMVSYSEFQCPFCGRFARETEPTLIKKYVKKGTLRIEWRDFPYLGEESTAAAMAGRAAAQQGRFWAFHDAMYADQQPPNSGRLSEDFLVGVARKVGLDTAEFRRTMRTRKVAEDVQRDFVEGQSAGVTGTPAFVVNGQAIVGAQPTDVFEQAIEQAAATAR